VPFRNAGAFPETDWGSSGARPVQPEGIVGGDSDTDPFNAWISSMKAPVVGSLSSSM
jgi:hypothetical protein